jgi:hypothetical protein
MANLWIISTGEFDGSQHMFPVIAESKEQVGAHIKGNIEKFLPIFESLFYCKYSHGNIYNKLAVWYSNDKFLDLMYRDETYRTQFITAIQNVLEAMSDKEIVDELYGFNNDVESIYVCVNETSIENLTDLRKK